MKKIIITALITLFVFPAFGQSNEIIDKILKQDQMDFYYTAYFVLSAGEIIDESTELSDVVEELNNLNWKFNDIKEGDKATLGATSLLIMNALQLKGGIMYSLLPNERYAYKELVFKGILKPEEDLKRSVSGIELLNLVGDALKLKEEKNE